MTIQNLPELHPAELAHTRALSQIIAAEIKDKADVI